MNEIDPKESCQNPSLPFYGYCDRCSAAIEIPGLDGSRCPNCGWIDSSKIVLAPPQPKTVKADTSLPPLPKFPRSNRSSVQDAAAPSQISLLAGEKL